MIKSRRKMCAGHVARMGMGEVFTWFCLRGRKRRKHCEDLGVGERIILRGPRAIGIDGADWIHLPKDRVHWRLSVKTEMKLRFP
jgi:hypothetical protein